MAQLPPFRSRRRFFLLLEIFDAPREFLHTPHVTFAYGMIHLLLEPAALFASHLLPCFQLPARHVAAWKLV